MKGLGPESIVPRGGVAVYPPVCFPYAREVSLLPSLCPRSPLCPEHPPPVDTRLAPPQSSTLGLNATSSMRPFLTTLLETGSVLLTFFIGLIAFFFLIMFISLLGYSFWVFVPYVNAPPTSIGKGPAFLFLICHRLILYKLY